MAVLVVAPSSCSYAKNSALLAQTDAVASEASKTPWSDPNVSVADKAKHLDDIRDQFKELDEWKQKGAPIGYRWGMYVGNDLYEPVRGVYVGNLQVGFASPTKARLEEELRVGSGASSLTTDQYNILFNRLKAYLEACTLDKLEPRLGVQRAHRGLGARARRPLQAGAGHPSQSRLLYVDLMKRQEIPLWTCDMNLVNRARSFLKRLSGADRITARSSATPTRNVVPVTRDSIFLNHRVRHLRHLQEQSRGVRQRRLHEARLGELRP